MNTDIYIIFGQCFNTGNYSSIANKLYKDCIYQSFDFLYILKGKEHVLKTLKNQADDNKSAKECDKIDIYSGFYQKSQFMFKTLKNCCIMTRRFDKKDIRILYFNYRWGKIISISGINPIKTKHVRVKKIN